MLRLRQRPVGKYLWLGVITSSYQQPLSGGDISSAMETARLFVEDDLIAAVEHLERIVATSPGEIPVRLAALLGRQGKRVRSSLLLLFSRMGGCDVRQEAQLGAAAVELLHTASLAHDDVIDEARMRRGEASAPQRWGNKMAVLVGDYAFARSMELAITTGNPEVVRAINRASCELVAGEIAEFDFARETNPTLDGYRKVIYGKTAVLLEVCCLAGASFSQLPSSLIETAAALGATFGMAFQMCDDLLDLNVSGTLDKPAHLDLQNGLLSLPALLEREINGGDLREWLSREPQAMVEHLRSTGVLEHAWRLIQEELSQAAAYLNQFPACEARSHVANLIEDLRLRTRLALG